MAGLLLSWENPTELFVPSVRKVTIDRRVGDVVTPDIQTDLTWGVAEDLGNDNVDAEYTIYYTGPFGEHLYTIGDAQILRYPRPPTICKITMEFIRPDGSPDLGRVVEFSDEGTENGQFVRRIVANTSGHAMFFAMPGAQLLVRVDGNRLAYQCVIPNLRDVTLETLFSQYGSQCDADPRRSLGVVW